MEKTFEELIEGESNIKLVDESDWNNIQFSALDMREFGKQVREATGNEFIKALEGVNLPTVATMKIMAIITHTNSIKTEL